MSIWSVIDDSSQRMGLCTHVYYSKIVKKKKVSYYCRLNNSTVCLLPHYALPRGMSKVLYQVTHIKFNATSVLYHWYHPENFKVIIWIHCKRK